jgi:hypothetical protein
MWALLENIKTIQVGTEDFIIYYSLNQKRKAMARYTNGMKHKPPGCYCNDMHRRTKGICLECWKAGYRYETAWWNTGEEYIPPPKKTYKRSGVPGVVWYSANKCWAAKHYVNKQPVYLGKSKDLIEAVKLKRAAEIKYGPVDKNSDSLAQLYLIKHGAA